MSNSTELFLPPSLPYPIKIASLDVVQSAAVQRGTRLLSYSFFYETNIPDQPRVGFGTWDSTVEGTVKTWTVNVGDVITRSSAKNQPTLFVLEPCKHGYSDSSRASIQMTYSAFGPTVSMEEARRIENENAERLLDTRRLSLIVDLDQTVVHATVDPTIGEWIAEGEAREAEQTRKTNTRLETEQGGNNIESMPNSCNPNWEALQDIQVFQLGPESLGILPSLGSMYKAQGKQKLIERQGCTYYVKPRPGWKGFLHHVSKQYEMHVYTMGTRSYAEAVCAAIDPDGVIFGGRILSRDESGSLTQKSLERLFPCDTSMVVIIDDRADVWEWSPNLVKVIPYDFFVGIGDINSTPPPRAPANVVPLPQKNGDSLSAMIASDGSQTQKIVPVSEGLRSGGEATENDHLALEAQLTRRAPALKQEELLTSADNVLRSKQDVTGYSAPEQSSRNEERSDQAMGLRQALLNNDDAELQRIKKLLETIHHRFFQAYDYSSSESAVRLSPIGGDRSCKLYDVTKIIPSMRMETFAGVHILFSSVIPLDTKPEGSEIWKVARVFGAHCYTELCSRVTHVVAAKNGTVKVDAARKRGEIKLVWLAWFLDSVALWCRQDEDHYRLDHGEGGPVPVLPTSQPQPTAVSDTDTRDPYQIDKPTSLELDEVDWDDINDEVEAAMQESDEEDSENSMSSGVTHTPGPASDTYTTSQYNRKRGRSPSDEAILQGTEAGVTTLKRRSVSAVGSPVGPQRYDGATCFPPGSKDDANDSDQEYNGDLDDFLALEIEEI